MITLSIVIVNYNVKEFLEQTLLSVQKAIAGISHEIYVVDNASTDGSVAMLQRKFPDIKVIANSENLGFAVANNQALSKVIGRFVLVLNPDTVVQEDTFNVIIAYFNAHPECGMVGCKILNPDGSLQLACRRSFPTPWVGLTRISGLSRLFPKSTLFGRYNLTFLDPDKTYHVEAISGSFMFLRKQVLDEVGIFDDSYFMYGEDLDLCYRIQKAGWKITYLPETKIIHFKGESSKKSHIDLTLQFYRAMQLFVENHYHHRYFNWLQWFIILGIYVRAGLSYLNRLLVALVPVFIDTLFLNLSLIIALLIRFGSLVHLRSYLVVTTFYTTVWLTCIASTGVYTQKRLYSIRAAAGVLMGFILNTSLTFFFNQYAYSREVVITASFFNVMLIAGWRFSAKLIPRLSLIFSRDISGNTLMGRRTLVVGAGKKTAQIVQRLREHVGDRYHLLGLIVMSAEQRQQNHHGLPVVGTLHELGRIIQQEKIQEVIFSSESIPYDHILEIMTKTRQKGVNFKLVPSTMEVIIGKASIDRLDALPLVDIDYAMDRPFSIFIKRSLDIITAGTILFCTSPIYLWYRVIRRIRIQKKQYFGLKSTPIDVAKFEAKANMVKRWQLLPRYWAVLKGDVSIVGSPLFEYDKTRSEDVLVKPGLFGLAQLQNQETLTDEDKKQYNLFYLKNYTPLLDIEIILKSLFNK